ncbi:Shedu anti-phage system protein SduA domain-containing protein [uncultured Draconibacterium sp.]|uniref:Shedu anti-phage system protein SduA domain-containing protein n=1 Tax=uncultured Draconibacterium sp. TaxID=1573823 RepID=UPI002AA77608|nr:Shedu anti-phage system protein SduA domain-containing protein [uncultured Draconibacterium sp.]
MHWHSIINTTDFKRNLEEEWNALLDENLTERHYHKFLIDNAGLFLGNENCHLVISKLKLGSDFETDFVTLSDGFSNGNRFELIEIKQPGAKLFTEKGLISKEFNQAIQQIRNWKRWLIDNRTWFKNYLPTINTRVISKSQLKFKIIIGRRLTNPHDIEKRNQIADEIGAEIRSFDYLSDKFKRREFYHTTWLATDKEFYGEFLANPFYKAFTDSKWKQFCNSEQISGSHFYSHHCEKILKYRKYNDRIK